MTERWRSCSTTPKPTRPISTAAAVLPGRRLGRGAILVVLITTGVDFHHHQVDRDGGRR
jgi:hypothetical protein